MDQNLELALTQSIKKSDTEEIFIEPVCNFFGIHLKNQIERIKRDKICQSDVRKNSCQSVFGDNKQRNCMGKRGFIRWIQIINAEIVRIELRDLFVQYQIAVFDYLYYGEEFKTAQLEDIRTYAENINSAIGIDRQVMEYIAEQKQHRDLCLVTPPNEWAQIKRTLTEEKILPVSTGYMKELYLPDDIEQLKTKKYVIMGYIRKAQNTILYQKETVQEKENPMPEGYKKEMKKLKLKSFKEQVEQIENKILAISKQLD